MRTVLHPYFVQRVHVILAISWGPWLRVCRGGRARTGAHHTVRGARGRARTGAQHCSGGGTWTRWGTRARGSSHRRIWRWHGPGSAALGWAAERTNSQLLTELTEKETRKWDTGQLFFESVTLHYTKQLIIIHIIVKISLDITSTNILTNEPHMYLNFAYFVIRGQCLKNRREL